VDAFVAALSLLEFISNRFVDSSHRIEVSGILVGQVSPFGITLLPKGALSFLQYCGQD